jgi:hypothetical protein
MSSRCAGLLAVCLVAATAAVGAAEAQKTKAKKGKVGKPARAACDLTYLPFTPGASWTYVFFLTTDAPAGIYVKDPDSFTVKVTAIEPAGADTVIKLEESYRKHVVATELRCNKDGLHVPPNSFFFFGEPGGGIGLELTDLKRVEGYSAQDFPGSKVGLKRGTELYGELKATAVRTPSAGTEAVLPRASVELERKLTVRGPEDVESKLGSHDSTPVQIELTGRANLEGQPKDKEFNMPAATTTLWVARGLGVVRVEGSNGKGWQLSEQSDGSEPPPAP